PVDQQHQADEPDKRRRVFCKEAPAGPNFRHGRALCRGSAGWDTRVDRRGHPFNSAIAENGSDAASSAKPDLSTRKTLSPPPRGRKAIPALPAPASPSTTNRCFNCYRWLQLQKICSKTTR